MFLQPKKCGTKKNVKSSLASIPSLRTPVRRNVLRCIPMLRMLFGIDNNKKIGKNLFAYSSYF
jgi:hypothetical protein